jgi:hypothetical protein
LEKSEGKRPLGRLKHRWEVNITVDLRETKWEVVDWIHLAHDKVQWRAIVNMIINLRIHD